MLFRKYRYLSLDIVLHLAKDDSFETNEGKVKRIYFCYHKWYKKYHL